MSDLRGASVKSSRASTACPRVGAGRLNETGSRFVMRPRRPRGSGSARRDAACRSRLRERRGEAGRNGRNQDGGRPARREAARVRATCGAPARGGSHGEPMAEQITFDATGLAIMAILRIGVTGSSRHGNRCDTDFVWAGNIGIDWFADYFDVEGSVQLGKLTTDKNIIIIFNSDGFCVFYLAT
ncbi:hypothetical protein [Burkholderia pseudomallei]|uniref:hypothetical protein n=1 Tax=Burkholderia pseudomallei TaxID=28450 RepID=UPI0015C4044B|nr:hypothetical protein [Burkholderia pseudomallei]